MRAAQPGDGWVECSCGRRHWGLHGAAGLLLVRRRPAGSARPGAADVVLQHRAPWSDSGDTWGIPGGAVGPDESPTAGALREAAEEAGIDPAGVEVVTTVVADHGSWSYTTVVARATAPLDPRPTDAESVAIAWVPLEDVAARPLHPGFATAWPTLRRLAENL